MSTPTEGSGLTPVRRSPAGIPRPRVIRERGAKGRAGRDDSDEESGLTPRFLWRVFRQRWTLIAPTSIICAAVAAAAVWFLHAPEFEASALVVIEDSVPFVAFDRGLNAGTTDKYVQTQIELLRSPMVLERVLEREELGNLPELERAVDPLEELRRNLSIGQVAKSELYGIGFVSRSAKGAADVVNAVLSEYMQIQSDEEYRRSQRVIAILEDERTARSLDVERLRNRVVELAKEVTGKDPFGQNALTNVDKVISPVASLYQELSQVEVNREVLKAEIQARQEAPMLVPDHTDASGLWELEIANSPEVRDLQGVADALQAAMKEVKEQAVAGENHPEYVKFSEQVGQVEAELEIVRKRVRAKMHDERMAARKRDYDDQIVAQQRELAALDARHKLLTEKFEKSIEEMQTGGAKSVELEFARSELAREEKVFELIAARKLALQTELRAPARVQLRQPAKTPLRALEPIPYKLLLLATSIALAMPFGLVIARESLARKIGDSEELWRESRLPVLGEIVRYPVRPVAGRAHALPKRLQREMLLFVESVDSLRTTLTLSEQIGMADRHRVLAISSAASGEGKTCIATSLAMSIAAADKSPTLVIDADLRSSEVFEILGVPAYPGLAEVLTGACSLSEAIHRVPNSHAYVMPAGRAKSSPHQILQPRAFEKLLGSLRSKFVTTIIDTPPVLAASESLVCAKAADGVLFCSMRDFSRTKQMQLALARLENANAPVLGTVLSGVSPTSYSYDYGHYLGHVADNDA